MSSATHGMGRSDPCANLDGLVRLVQHGDADAMGILARRMNQEIANHATRIGASISDIDDLTQMIWLKTWQRLPNFNWDSSFRTWIYKVAHNTTLDHLECLERIRRYDQEGHEARGCLKDDDDPVGDVVVELDQRDEVRALLQLLSPQHRAVLVLIDAEGFPAPEAAKILGISTKACSSRLARARKAMRALLSDRPEEGVE